MSYIRNKLREIKIIFLLTRLWIVLILLVLTLGLFQGGSGIKDYVSLLKSKEQLQDLVNRLESEAKEIESEIIKVSNSKSYARKVYKDKYHVTQEGETIIFFSD